LQNFNRLCEIKF